MEEAPIAAELHADSEALRKRLVRPAASAAARLAGVSGARPEALFKRVSLSRRWAT